MHIYPSENQAFLQKARDHFAEGFEIPPDLIPAALWQSWERSRNAGLTPRSRGLQSSLAGRHCIEQAKDENRRLIEHAQPEMELLWRSLKDPFWTLLCSNSQGQVIHNCNTGSTTFEPLKYLGTGRRLLENELGTTAPGCALKEGRPFVVTASQHYLQELDKFFCAAFPIWSPEGQMLGVVDVTGVNSVPPTWLQERLNLTATAIENRLFMDIPAGRLLYFHGDPRLLNTPLEGIIAFSADGRLLHANRSARSLLGLDDARIVKGSIEELFGNQWESSLSILRCSPNEIHPLVLATGKPFYGRMQLAAEEIASRPTRKRSAIAEPPTVFSHDNRLASDFRLAAKAFAGDVPIMVQGETGTGKEVFAKALHNVLEPNSPFIAINCSAIPSSLIEAELFGYNDGAFTGGRRGGAVGKVELASGGTLFLDEIGDMPLDMQTRLLRVLQERKFTRVGGTKEISLNFRLISASHKDLKDLVAGRLFREDLYYRLNGLSLTLLPLRDRSNLPMLVADILRTLSSNNSKQLDAFAMEAVQSFAWPGNVRQLFQALKVAAIFSGDEPLITLDNFPPDLQQQLKQHVLKEPGQSPLKKLERDAIHKALAHNLGNVSATASQLGISRSTLYKKIRT